jgi:hypothetical protein
MDRVSSSRLRKIHERAFARSFEIVRGTTRGVFPDVCGISLGELNLQGIQAYLASFSVLSAAVGDLLEEGEIGACHILSGDDAATPGPRDSRASSARRNDSSTGGTRTYGRTPPRARHL